MIKHPNIVKLKEVLASKSKIYLVLELIKGGDLFEVIKESKDGLEESIARKYFQQIIRGVEYCHRRGISHRDLKPENILMNEEGVIKISDFGLSALNRKFHEGPNLMHTTCGTLNYIAPEIVKNTGYDGQLADIWACGVILFFCLTAKRPFDDESVHKLLDKIMIGDFKFNGQRIVNEDA